jgi:two-component system, NarL family, sensor histidine kinase DesK
MNTPAEHGGPKRYRWIRFIWVVYSLFFFFEPIQRHSLRSWILIAIAYPIFLVFYFLPYVVRGWKQKMLVAGMFVLGLVYVPLNPSAIGIFVFAAAALPFCFESTTTVYLLIGVECIGILIQGLLLSIPAWAWGTAIFFTVIVGIANTAFAQERAANAKLLLAQEEVEHLAKVAERERIARDMHDVLGHTLSVIVLKAELAGKLVTRDPERAGREMKDLEEIARRALTEVREAIRGYRSQGLLAEIERTQRTLDAAGVKLRCDSAPPTLTAPEETVLSLILREAVTNIVRHAGASTCLLHFETEQNYHLLTVADDGRGGVIREGNGLRGMRERVEAMGGKFLVVSENGTRLTVGLPVIKLGQMLAGETVAS